MRNRKQIYTNVIVSATRDMDTTNLTDDAIVVDTIKIYDHPPNPRTRSALPRLRRPPLAERRPPAIRLLGVAPQHRARAHRRLCSDHLKDCRPDLTAATSRGRPRHRDDDRAGQAHARRAQQVVHRGARAAGRAALGVC